MTGDSINREAEGLTEEYFAFFDEDDQEEECCECGGEGWIEGECFEDTCCCLNPAEEHGVEPCPNCNPNGTD